MQHGKVIVQKAHSVYSIRRMLGIYVTLHGEMMNVFYHVFGRFFLFFHVFSRLLPFLIFFSPMLVYICASTTSYRYLCIQRRR